MSSLEEQIADLKSAILDHHKQIIKAVNICTADKHVVHVSRLCTRISLNYLGLIENRFVFKKRTVQPNSINPGKVQGYNKQLQDHALNTALKVKLPEFEEGTKILVDILTKKGEIS